MRDNSALIDLVDEIDISNIEHVRAAFARAAAMHPRTITVSFSRTRYFDAKTVHALDELQHEAGPGTRIQLIDADAPTVARLIRLLGLDKAFTLLDGRHPKGLISNEAIDRRGLPTNDASR